jgi:hypothetical protein
VSSRGVRRLPRGQALRYKLTIWFGGTDRFRAAKRLLSGSRWASWGLAHYVAEALNAAPEKPITLVTSCLQELVRSVEV